MDEAGVSYTMCGPTRPSTKLKRRFGCIGRMKCDAIVAMGGGSCMDCAKAIGARVAYLHKSLAQMAGVMRMLRPPSRITSADRPPKRRESLRSMPPR